MRTRYLVLSAACLVVGAPLAMAQQTTLERSTQNQGQTANQARGQANRSNGDLPNDDQNDNNSDRDNRDRNSSDQQNDRDRSDRDRGGFLGVAVEPVHPSFSSHVQGRVAEGQGLVVVEVASNSPAEKAGLREHDVITTVDDQRLYSPEQLIGLMRQEKAGKQVKIAILREGKERTLTATLGDQRAARRAHAWLPDRDQAQDQQGRDQQGRDRQGRNQQADNDRNDNWERFDAMTVTRLDNDRFRAEIDYRDRSGQIQHKRFEGSRDQIRQDIDQQQDLPRSERRHLDNALGMTSLLDNQSGSSDRNDNSQNRNRSNADQQNRNNADQPNQQDDD